MRSIRVGMTLFACAWAASASAQLAPPAVDWTRGTELTLQAGRASASSTSGATVGASVQWDLSRWVAVQGRASWFDRGFDATAFGGDLNALVNLVARRAVTPFVGIGGGVYRASFGSAGATMPAFYRDRLTTPGVGATSRFTDPALRVTAGVDLVGQAPRRHWTVRPEVSLVTVFAGGGTETIATVLVGVGYRFRASDRGDARERRP